MSAQGSIISVTSPQPVQGGAPDGTAASGFPVQLGGKYEVADPVYADGNIGYLRIDQNGHLLVNGLPQSLGQKPMATSMSVAIASDQSAVPIKLDDGAGTSITAGQKTMAGSLPVVLPSDQAAIPIKLDDGSGASVTVGQKAMAGSLPVVISSDQSAINTTDASNGSVAGGSAGSKSALIGGQYRATPPTLTDLQQVAFQVDTNGKLIVSPLTNSSVVKAQLQDNAGTAITLGAKVKASSIPVAWASEQEAQIGALTETAPATDTASSGLNGRLQRLAQNISSLIALLPSSIGQKTSATSLGVVLASDQPSIPSKPDAFINGTQTTGTALSTAVTLTAPSNAIGFVLQAAGSNANALRWRIGAVATTTVGQRLEPGADSGYIPCGANISLIPEAATTCEYEIQWVQR